MKADRPHHLYRWFDADGNLLYIGISVNAYSRAKQHQGSSGWFSEAVQMTLEVLPTLEDARQAEKSAIQSEHPRYNRVHVRVPDEVRLEEKAKKFPYVAPSFWRESGRVCNFPGKVMDVKGDRCKVKWFHPVTGQWFSQDSTLEHVYGSKSLKRLTGHPDVKAFSDPISWRKAQESLIYPTLASEWAAEVCGELYSRDRRGLLRRSDRLWRVAKEAIEEETIVHLVSWWGRPGLRLHTTKLLRDRFSDLKDNKILEDDVRRGSGTIFTEHLPGEKTPDELLEEFQSQGYEVLPLYDWVNA